MKTNTVIQNVYVNKKSKLMILMDDKCEHFNSWLKNFKVRPTIITNSLSEISVEIEENTEEPIVVVIIDTGMGLFTSNKHSSNMLEFLGLSKLENINIFYVYSDGTMKVDARSKLGRNKIKWRLYKGLVESYKMIRRFNLEYTDIETVVYVEEKAVDEDTVKNDVHYKEEEVELEHNVPIDLDLDSIKELFIKEDRAESMKGFKVKNIS